MKKMLPESKVEAIRKEGFLNRAVEAYRFFYPTVSNVSNFKALNDLGITENHDFIIQLTTPDLNVLTQNSDTPYCLGTGNTENGPVVIELPQGAIVGVADDINFKFITNMGLTGDEQGKGAKYLYLPPNYDGDIPEGYIVRNPSSYRFLICLRAMVHQASDYEKAFELLKKVKFYPLEEKDNNPTSTFHDFSHRKAISTPYYVEGKFDYWEVIKWALDNDETDPEYYQMYGLLKAIGLAPNKEFNPDPDKKALLIEAAEKADKMMFVNSFNTDDPAAIVWPGKNWEWAVYGENNDFYEKTYLNLPVRERWFYQATLETHMMFMHKVGFGSVYMLGVKDKEGNYLDGGKSYTLKVPTPVPTSIFWSVTVYEMDTRSEIVTEQFMPALNSIKDTFEVDADGNTTLYFGPNPPEDESLLWIQTVPDANWFTYFRIYGPTEPAFDNSWQLYDFEEVK
ncbi:DUF1254 domain-containing protein [Listeria monocytogenes]|nr:DUF1254 domain-containing protein [Listeria monocytogenes]